MQTAAPLFFQIVDSLRSQSLDQGEPARAAPARCGSGAAQADDDGSQIVSPLRGASYVLRLAHNRR